MLKTLLCTAALAAATAAAAAMPGLTLERIASDPPLAGRQPRQAEISPGGAWVSWLQPSAADSEQLELWAQATDGKAGAAPRRLVAAADLLAGAEQKLSEAEKMALERKRISQRGITSYLWCGPDDRTLLFPLSGDLYLVRFAADGLRAQRLTLGGPSDAPAQDPACSPDGRKLAYVKGGNLHLLALDDANAQPRALTGDATATLSWGLAEFVAAEELDRMRGFWWSPDGRQLLALRVDEGGVPIKVRAQIHATRTALTEQRYPAAGETNARVEAFVIDAASGARSPLPLPPEAEYIARAGWFGDGAPWLQWFDRPQTRLVLAEFDARAGTSRMLVDERDAAWVETHDDLAELPGYRLSGRPALLWSSERSGRRQLELIDRTTGARRPLTAQGEPVARFVCSDGARIVFTGAAERGRARELFAVDANNGKTRPLAGAAEHQWRDARGDRACRRLLVTRAAWGEPPRLELRAVDGNGAAVAIAGEPADPLLAAIVPTPEPLAIVAADGRTPLNAFYFAPLGPAKSRHPALVLAYGGPHATTVAWNWNRDLPLIAWWQRRGYAVMTLDTRGMYNRDREFTRAHKNAFGQVDAADLFAAVRQLPQLRPAVDAARVGFYGWSYGGYLAARAMLDADTPLAAAVAVAAPTDWTLYDTAYTERYLGMPGEGGNATAYRDSNLLARAALLAKPLMLVHGTADDNVLFEHALRLTEALQNEGKLFDQAIYPGKAHGIAGRKARLHLYRTIDAFFERHLQPSY